MRPTEITQHISIYPTPNPNALKFVTQTPIKLEGNSTYRNPMDCAENPLALQLFSIRGVDQLFFFDHSITVTKFGYESWDSLEQQIMECLEKNLPNHDPDYHDPDPERERRASLSNELKEIELILDKTIRTGLQADGGDIQTVSYEDNCLLVRYSGACGTCPSSTTGTLEAIKGILRDQYNPQIEVYIAPEW